MKKLSSWFNKRRESSSSDLADTPGPAIKSSGIAPAPSSKSFADLGLIAALLRAVDEEGYQQPTPIQIAAIPEVLKGRDLLGCAQTGTGKTAAFALPILQRLAAEHPRLHGIRALILTPTRELALQIDENFRNYGRHLRLGHALVFGGVGLEPQKQALARRPEILVATPGRLLDLMGQGCVDLQKLEVFVLDEADRMLDMGFINDVRKVIAALPKKRQNLLFSATMPREIQDLVNRILHDPARVEVAPVSSTSELVEQALYYVDRPNKRRLLLHVLTQPGVTRALVFTRTKAIANRVAGYLSDAGIQSEAIHGNKSQNARQRALANFKNGDTPVLVASDLAARGIDVDLISHVINYDLPNVPETYVHRIGRTGRAENRGIAVSFCDAEERPFVTSIERLIRQRIPVIADHPFPAGSAPAPGPAAEGERGSQSARGGHGGRQGNRPGQGRSPHPHGSRAERPGSGAAGHGGGQGRRRRPAGRGGRPGQGG